MSELHQTSMTTADCSRANKDQVRLSHTIAYSLPTIMTTFLSVPLVNIVPGLYAKHFGLTLSTIAIIMLAARLFDAISDPIIGYFSDHIRERTGTRKPFIMVGGLFFLVSSYYLYVPPVEISAGYLLGCLLAFYLSWTLFEIPHIAWGGELSVDSREKSKIYSIRYFFINTGILLFFVVPFLPFFKAEGFTMETMKWSVLIASILMFPLIYICIKTVPNGHQYKSNAHQKIVSSSFIAPIIRNRPLLIFLCSYALSGIGIGIWMSVSYIFMDAYLGLGSKAPLIYTLATLVSLFCVSLWYKLANQVGKKITFCLGMLVVSIAAASTGILKPGETSFLFMSIAMSAIYAGAAVLFIFGPSLLADIADYGIFKFGVDRAGTYFAFYTFISKANAGLGSGLGLGILGWYGFDPAEVNHADEHLFGLRLAMACMPVILIILSLLFIVKMPINERRHGIIQRCLVLRENRLLEKSPGKKQR